MSALGRGLVAVALACACGKSRPSVEQQSPPPNRPATPATAVAATSSPVRSVTLERMRCYGTCPAYEVTLRSDGAVRFEGIANVAAQGIREWRVPADSAARVFRLADSIAFNDLPEKYEFGVAGCTPYVADLPAFAVTLGTDAKSRRVYVDQGCQNAPAALKALGELIDGAAGVERAVTVRR